MFAWHSDVLAVNSGAWNRTTASRTRTWRAAIYPTPDQPIKDIYLLPATNRRLGNFAQIAVGVGDLGAGGGDVDSVGQEAAGFG
jgi:hypothetical protein